MEERRRYVRFDAPFPVNLMDKEFSQRVSGVIKDISYKGTRILLDEPLENFSSPLLELSILFPEGSLLIQGRILWTQDLGNKKEIGLSFVSITDRDKEIIYNRIFRYFKEEFTRRWWQ